MTNKEIIERLSYFRTLKNLSARKLSLMLGKHQAYINKLEAYDFNLNTGTLLEILETLEITPEEFFCLGTDFTPKSKEINKLFNNLSSPNKETVMDLLRKLQ